MGFPDPQLQRTLGIESGSDLIPDFLGTGDLLCGDPQASFHSGAPRQKGWVGIGVDLKRYRYEICDIENTCGLRFFLQGCLVGGF